MFVTVLHDGSRNSGGWYATTREVGEAWGKVKEKGRSMKGERCVCVCVWGGGRNNRLVFLEVWKPSFWLNIAQFVSLLEYWQFFKSSKICFLSGIAMSSPIFCYAC